MSLFNKDKIPNNEDKTQIYILRNLISINNIQVITLKFLVKLADVVLRKDGLCVDSDELSKLLSCLCFSKEEIMPDE